MTDRVGYEDLLRPLKDALLKNWSMSLAHVLDEFIAHLQHESVAMNFSKAAVLLQNSTAFYCKRLEVVFKLMEELKDGVNHLKADEAEASGLAPCKRRRMTRVLENEDVELLDFVHSEINIDLHVERLRTVPPKEIVLNREVKALKKPNATIPLSSSSVFFGYKDDFRVFGKTWSDGTVNREFHNDWTKKLISSMDIVLNGCSDHQDNHDDVPVPDMNDNIEKTAVNGLEVPISNGIDSPDLSLALPLLREVKVSLEKVEDWPLMEFVFNTRLKALTRKRAFTLPKSLIEEAEIEKEKRKKLDEKRESRKEKALAKLNAAMKAAEVNGTEVVDSNGTCHEGMESGATSPPNGDISEILLFKQQRQQKGQEATELAQRVSQWHESVLPRLQEAESRRKFNVHEYGNKILDEIPDTDTTFHSFQEIVRDQPRHEVCRYFLSTLMLANTYNVELTRTGSDPLAADCLELKLLTKVRHHDEMDYELENLS